MKLVKVDVLKNGVFHFEGLAVEGEILAYQKGWNDALSYVILDAPTVDAVEVVRCKDCKWRGELGCAVSIVDESDIPNDDDYCSWGEKKDDK